MPRFGEKLRTLRTYYGLSYRKLGADLNYDFAYLAKLEAGTRMPSYELIVKIAEYFEVSFDELMNDKIELKL